MKNSGSDLYASMAALCMLISPVCMAERASEGFEVIVVGGSSGAFGAALAAGRMGAKVALIEDTPVLGGHLSNSVTIIDSRSLEALSGIFEEFRLNVKAHYAPLVQRDPDASAMTAEELGEYKEFVPIEPRVFQTHARALADGAVWEPQLPDEIFKGMLAPLPNLHVFYNTYATAAIVRQNRVVGVVTRNEKNEEKVLYGKVIIDATHEADIAAWAGVPYRVGREARSFLEPHAGEIFFLDETGEIMSGSTGRQDAGVVSYGLRLTLQVYSGGAPEVAAPPGYRKEDYIASGCSTYSVDKVIQQVQVNMNPIGSELQGINWHWPEATHEERERLYELYKNHALGYVHYLQTNCGFKNLGLPQKAYVNNGHIPYRLYVREARRIVGEETMTEADINPFVLGNGLIPTIRSDSIAIGYYEIDSKPVLPKTDLSRPDKGNGDFFLPNASFPFQVPYGAIVPEHIDGLLVPVGISATHVAFSAIRMEPTWMEMGQAAGVAAVLSLRDRLSVRDLSVDELQRELLRQKVRLFFYWDVPLEHPAFAAIQWLSTKKIIEGYPSRDFRPDQAITRSELAGWIVNALKLWPSVSNQHFKDVPYTHPAFRAIETLFDNGLLVAFGVEPMWPKVGGFTPTRNIGFFQRHGTFGQFQPDLPVTWREAIEILRLAEATTRSSRPDDESLSSAAKSLQQAKQGLQKRLGVSEFSTALKIPDDLSRRVSRADFAMVLGGCNFEGLRRDQVARYGKPFKDRAVARLLPPESLPVDHR